MPRGKKKVEEPSEVNLDYGDLNVFCDTLAFEEGEAASDAGERRQRIGEFMKITGVNGKALSFYRMTLKRKKEVDRLDILRSMEILVPMLRRRLMANTTPDMLEGPSDDKPPEEDFDNGPPPGAERARAVREGAEDGTGPESMTDHDEIEVEPDDQFGQQIADLGREAAE